MATTLCPAPSTRHCSSTSLTPLYFLDLTEHPHPSVNYPVASLFRTSLDLIFYPFTLANTLNISCLENPNPESVQPDNFIIYILKLLSNFKSSQNSKLYMMVNFICQLDWGTACLDKWLYIIFGCVCDSVSGRD